MTIKITLAQLIFFSWPLLIGYIMKHDVNNVEYENMTVEWMFLEDSVHFTIQAPTRGWLTVGFNEDANIMGAYLLMGRVQEGTTEVVEYHTLTPGVYRPIISLGGKEAVRNVSGVQRGRTTRINFTVPQQALGIMQKDLEEGSSYYMTLAYSQSNDFQHHSLVRTCIKVRL